MWWYYVVPCLHLSPSLSDPRFATPAASTAPLSPDSLIPNDRAACFEVRDGEGSQHASKQGRLTSNFQTDRFYSENWVPMDSAPGPRIASVLVESSWSWSNVISRPALPLVCLKPSLEYHDLFHYFLTPLFFPLARRASLHCNTS